MYPPESADAATQVPHTGGIKDHTAYSSSDVLAIQCSKCSRTEGCILSICLPVRRKERNSSNLRRLKLSGASHPGKLGIKMSAVICIGASELRVAAGSGH